MEDTVIRPIKSPADHTAALHQIDALMVLDTLNATQRAELEVIAILVEKYEQDQFPIPFPTPVEAIEFRMDQLGLSRAELADKVSCPRSRISDVLNGKRGLSLELIRALHGELGIPADVLLGKRAAAIPADCADVTWTDFPLAEMAKNNWIPTLKPFADSAEACIRDLMAKAAVSEPHFAGVAFRGTEHKKPDPYAVNAWLMFARHQANIQKSVSVFDPSNIDAAFRREIAKLSLYSDGPQRAFDALNDVGVTAVCVKALKKTHIDGACFRLPNGSPAIALTLRHNRLDNFWFTLLHECVHVERHLNELDFILDETEGQTGAFGNEPIMESEANSLARNALVPTDIYEDLVRNKGKMSKSRVQQLANAADVHVAVIAGQWRSLTGQYTHFSKLVGQGRVSDVLNCS